MKPNNNTDLFKLAEARVACRMSLNPTIPNEARKQLVREEYSELLWDDYSDYGDDTTGLFGCTAHYEQAK